MDDSSSVGRFDRLGTWLLLSLACVVVVRVAFMEMSWTPADLIALVFVPLVLSAWLTWRLLICAIMRRCADLWWGGRRVLAGWAAWFVPPAFLVAVTLVRESGSFDLHYISKHSELETQFACDTSNATGRPGGGVRMIGPDGEFVTPYDQADLMVELEKGRRRTQQDPRPDPGLRLSESEHALYGAFDRELEAIDAAPARLAGTVSLEMEPPSWAQLIRHRADLAFSAEMDLLLWTNPLADATLRGRLTGKIDVTMSGFASYRNFCELIGRTVGKHVRQQIEGKLRELADAIR